VASLYQGPTGDPNGVVYRSPGGSPIVVAPGSAPSGWRFDPGFYGGCVRFAVDASIFGEACEASEHVDRLGLHVERDELWP
jgi:hypothetical protein